jgi:hypothetical protein
MMDLSYEKYLLCKGFDLTLLLSVAVHFLGSFIRMDIVGNVMMMMKVMVGRY